MTTANGFAQNSSVDLEKIPAIPAHRAKAIYGELGGNGLLFSVNSEFRFTKVKRGLA